MHEPMFVDRLVFRGMHDAEVADVQLTACPNWCEPMRTPCPDACRRVVRDCMRCACGNGQVDCLGYESERDLNLLMVATKRQISGCQFVNGYRRQVRLYERRSHFAMHRSSTASTTACHSCIRAVHST